MFFGGLGQKEFEQVVEILKANSIEFQFGSDGQVIESNKDLAKDPLQHFTIQTANSHALGLEVDEQKLKKLDAQTQQALNELGLYWEESPFGETFEEEIEPIAKSFNKATRSNQMSAVFWFNVITVPATLLILWVLSFTGVIELDFADLLIELVKSLFGILVILWIVLTIVLNFRHKKN
jgi:hypothetical protein